MRVSGAQARIFGKRRESHILILASGEKVRHMTIRPWMAGLAVCIFGIFTIVYLTATAYLVLRDDLLGAAMARQARMQHEYEDRIAALRAQVDRITSRQLLDQQVVEQKVEKLLQQQTALASRHGKLGSILERAENSGLDTARPATLAEEAEKHSDAGAISVRRSLLADIGLGRKSRTSAPSLAAEEGSIADKADRLFSKVTLSLKRIEQDQLAHLRNLAADATERARTIEQIVANTGLRVPEFASNEDGEAESGIGGPFVDPEIPDPFESSILELDVALNQLDHVKNYARRLPLSHPGEGKEITSTFGHRMDPFFGKLALHAGIDFRQKTGQKVVASGAGKVIHAGPAGGYGILVEIDHGDGITTRYGHLSKVLVKEGQKVEQGDVIALSGNTGRSTGPHLHYEVRRNNRAVDPMRFLNAGMKLQTYID
jgi:murein DD-endopeptidase MepM/ murein hydrolase activator NlpD